jgi:hypothetical protein
VGGELEVREWADPADLVVGPEVDTLVLANPAATPVDEPELGRRLARIEGVSRVRSLVISPDSQVRDLAFLPALPGLATVEVYGLRVASLAGLARPGGWDYLKVDTGRNRRRSLAELAGTAVQRLSVRWAGRPDDLAAVAASRGVVDLELHGWPELPLAALRELPVVYLALVSGRFPELGGTAAVPSLRRLRLVDCRALRRLTGDNRNVTWLTVWSCHQLELATVTSFPRLTTLEISSQRRPVRLSALAGLAGLESLTIDDSRVEVDLPGLTVAHPRLSEVAVSELGDDRLRELSRANRGVTVTNGLAGFRDGEPVELDDLG